jgi:nitrate reductase gamma subunit
VPLRIVTTPAPKTRYGVIWRLFGDFLWFPNLYKADKLLWAAGFFFHLALWIVLLRHLRYFLFPVPKWVEGIQTVGLYAGYALPLPLVLFLARRLTINHTIYISTLGDYFAIFLLLTVTVSGILLQVFFSTYVIDVKAMILGLIHFQPFLPQAHWLFVLHFISVMVLLVYFPFGKLLHAGGFFLSPTRNQRANFERRFVNPWDSQASLVSSSSSVPEVKANSGKGGNK